MIELKLQKVLNGADGKMQYALEVNIEQGKFISIYGPSGAGKTSTLRMLAGLLKPDAGQIMVNGQTWFNAHTKTNLSPQKRKLGFVFQDYALFPNQTVKQHLHFALQKKQDTKTVDQLLKTMDLSALQNRKPDTLSGGQKQRLALARALVQKPNILLLDEPFSALDTKTRAKLQDYLHQAHVDYGLTTFLISHDLAEVMKLSDRVLLLENGELTKYGSPNEVFAGQEISGKFKFTGEVLHIQKEEIVFIVRVRVQSTIIQVIAEQSEIEDLQIGDQVMLVSKAFNPMIYKLKV